MSALAGRLALVTGAGTGIGRETAILLARAGARVVLVGRRREPLEEVAAAIAVEGGAAHPYVADISHRSEVGEMVASLSASHGTIDILVNNAGRASGVLNVRWIEEDDWDETVALNLKAVYLLTQAVLPGMLAAGGGTIVTVSSLAAERPNLLGGAAYGAAKSGVRNFMTYLRNTFRNDMIRATSVLPGETDTPIMDKRARPPEPHERAVMLDPRDVAEAVLLCCSLPLRAVVEELWVAPTRQRDISADLEVARWLGAPAGTRGTPSVGEEESK